MVSAVMPNYNDAATIGESLTALLDQSLTSLEIIVVDDASTDNSVDVISEFARRDRRVRMVRRERNEGPIVAQLTGFALATGKYILGPSADDAILPGFLETMVAHLEASPAAVALCDIVCPANPEWNLLAGISDTPVSLMPHELVAAIRKRPFVLGGEGTLVRRSAYKEAGWLVPELRWMADYFAVHVAAFRHGLCYVPKPLHSMRVPEYSNSGSRTAAHRQATLTLLALLTRDEYRDVRPAFVRSGALAAVPGILRAVASAPRHSDVLTPLMVRRCFVQAAKDLLRPVTPGGLRRAYQRMSGALAAPSVSGEH